MLKHALEEIGQVQYCENKLSEGCFLLAFLNCMGNTTVPSYIHILKNLKIICFAPPYIHVYMYVYEDSYWERFLRGGLFKYSGTLFGWRSEFTQKHAQSTGNHMERLWKKNLDQKFDLTQKLEQFPEKKVGPPKFDLILLRIPM